jgi:hypothetical protein
MSMLPRLTLVTLTASLMLAACSDKQTTRPAPVVTSTPTRSTTAVTTTRTVDSEAAAAQHSTSTRTSKAHLPDHTGIPACDDYLASYMACHRAAGIYSPSQLPMRYEAMRSSLLRDSQDPDIRPQLAARCNSLASTLRDALHGKACDVTPPPPSTSTSP